MRIRHALFALTLMLPGVLSAQAVADELALFRDATVREQAGDFAGARHLLERILRHNPQSLSSLLALERVLRMQAKPSELLPFVAAHLEADASSPIGNQMLVRTYSVLDRVDDLERAAAAWIRESPKLETPYREIARVWIQRNDWTRALQVLEAGRKRIGKDALALELGDAYAAIEEYDRAVTEWDRAIGRDGRGLMLVQRRVASLRDGGARVLPPLVEALMRPPVTFPRKHAAVLLAIDAGLTDRALQIMQQVTAELKGSERQSFLVEVARRADAAHLPRVAYAGYSQIAPGTMNPEQTLAIRARLAELALAAGDTAGAARSYEALEQSLAAGSPQRRQAIALRIQLLVKEGKLEQAEQELAAFRQEYPAAPELDATAALLAGAFIDREDLERAEKTLAGTGGPRSRIALGRVSLRRGDIDEAKAAFLAAAPALHGAEATETIRLVTLLGKVSRPGGELLAKALARTAAGAPAEAFNLLDGKVDALPEPERPAILEFAASLADRAQLPLEAERVRRRIIDEFAQSVEAPAALLALARGLAERGEVLDEVRAYLEKLILEYPRSALVPQARQELDRLQGRVPRS